jgi:hypothetical protein
MIITTTDEAIGKIAAIKVIRTLVPELGLIEAKLCADFLQKLHEVVTLRTVNLFIRGYLDGKYLIVERTLYFRIRDEGVSIFNDEPYRQIFNG